MPSLPVSKDFAARGVAFDMDGTIIDSTLAIEGHWKRIAKELDIDPEVVLATSHGRRTIDTLAEIDPQNANWDYVLEIEARMPVEFADSAVEIPGAKDLLQHFRDRAAPWSIVTSGSTVLVSGWLKIMGIPQPPVVVASNNVDKGKPHPEGYLKAKKAMGLPDAADMIVFEDAPSGIKAGKAAGAVVIGLATTFDAQTVRDAGADVVVPDLTHVQLVSAAEEGLVLRVRSV